VIAGRGAGRGQGRGDPARGRVRWPGRADRGRGRTTVRAATPIQGLPAGQGRTRHDLRPPRRPWYADNGVELRLGVPVTGIDRAAHEVTLADDSRIGYARLLLATGSSPRRLRVPGADADRRASTCAGRATATRSRPPFRPPPGSRSSARGWIGLECAAAARAAGVEVTLLEGGRAAVAGGCSAPEVARVFAGLPPRARRGPCGSAFR